MRYARYYSADSQNGPGLRAVLFTQGCIHACKGCYNKTTWDPEGGQEFTKELEDQIIADLKDTDLVRHGLTLTGGDPFHDNNIRGVMRLITRVRKECPDKTIWVWTGYTREEIDAAAIDFENRTDADVDRGLVMNHGIDVLVDGKFVQELHDKKLKYRGSSNQIIHVFKGELC